MGTETGIDDDPTDQIKPERGMRVWADEDEFQALARRVAALEALVSKGDET